MQVDDAEASKRWKFKASCTHGGPIVPVGVDHGFTFRYRKKDEPFVNDWDACADLFWLIRGSSKDLPPVNELEEAEAYKDLARTIARVSF